MLTAGVIILLGFVFIMVKLPRNTALRLLGYPLTIDIVVSVLAYILHWGTFTGVMAAAVAGMLCSLTTSAARWAFGYIDPKTRAYYRGHFYVRSK